jgi:hypothetical protein
MAVAVACVDVAAEPVRVWWQIHLRALWAQFSSCETYTPHCQGCEKNRSLRGKEGNFWYTCGELPTHLVDGQTSWV